MTNKLAYETSPYLLQHKDNPVDWYPWSSEAFAVARAADKPVLLSIGYAACHWCHVMERESFEDDDTARIMNESYVSIKVDREERPDIDSLYMDAVQVLTGQGGWPMTMFLTPEGLPFYGGTYFPPSDRMGLPSFRKVLTAVVEAWRERRSEIEKQGRTLVDHLDVARRVQPSSGDIARDILDRSVGSISKSFDAEYGGFGDAPKFPQPMVVDFLLRLAARGRDDAGGMATRTLDGMSAGGLFDQLGGGFARYSVDRFWLVPHFEKMLYDNSQLLRTYARSWMLTGSQRHREVAEATAAWMLREMRDPRGGFWSSLDADSEGEEGRFYLWTMDEVRSALGEEASFASEQWGFSEEGNFEGRNIPVRVGANGDAGRLAEARAKLLAVRDRRVRPATDSKVLAGWNALAAAALAETGTILARPELVAAGRQAMEFVFSTLCVNDRLMRSYRATGEREAVKHLAVCEDYAFVLEACIALYEATHDMVWLQRARWTADNAIRLFSDDERGGFFSTGSDAESLVARPKDLFDNAIPSANSVMALVLQKLASLISQRHYEDRAVATMKLVVDTLERAPSGFGTMLEAIDWLHGDPVEIVIIGDPAGKDTHDLVHAVRSRYLPNKVLIVAPENHAGDLPLLESRSLVDGRATAYVCRRGTCRAPVTAGNELLVQLQ